MAPVAPDALIRCRKQTSDLFDIFLELDENDLFVPRKSMECKKVYTLERDSTASLKSANESSILSRSPGIDVRRYREDYKEKEKRRSLEIAKRRSVGTPPLPSTSPLAGNFVLQCDRVEGFRHSESNSSTTSLERNEVVKSIRKPAPFQSEYVEFPGEEEAIRRSRTYSVGPTEEQIREAALTLVNVGDQIQKDYGSNFKLVEQELCKFVREAGKSLTYEVFAAHVNDVVEQDRNWRNFMFVMQLSKRVIKTTQTAGSMTKEYFRRFVGDAFVEEIATHTDVVSYVRDNSMDK